MGRHQRPSAVSLAGMDHQRRPQAHRRHVHAARAGDAAARVFGRHHDAAAAGARLPGARLPAAGAFRPDLLRARHDHDLLRGHAVRDRPDELRRAAAARRSRRGLSDAQLGRLLADRDRRAARQPLAGDRRVRANRLAAVSAAFRADLLTGRRRRLLPVGDPDFRCRNADVRHQPGDDRSQDAGQGHELSAHADVLLDDACVEPADRRGVSDSHRDAGDAAARSLSRLSFFHQ